MTDRIHTIAVVLEQDMREDDAKDIIRAIRQLRGVLTVQPQVADYDSHMAEARARDEVLRRLRAVVKEFGADRG